MAEKTKILIVDDRVENLITLESLLEQFDVELIRATSGEEALAKALDHDFALILLDVQMPGMDGFEVAEFMRRKKKSMHIPIIFITAASKLEANIFRGYESGAVDYLLKPLNPDIFQSKVSIFIQLHEQRMELNERLAELEELKQELEEKNSQLIKLSNTDGLTGLINKRYFEELFSEEWHRAMRTNRPLSLVLLDIDNFKKYNDSFGHHMGDDCLKAIARALESIHLRQADKVARIGGEEFAIVLPETDVEGAQLVAERTRETIEALKIPHSEESGRPWVTASIGFCAVIPAHNIKPRLLFEASDAALYESKHNGRNQCSYKPLQPEE